MSKRFWLLGLLTIIGVALLAVGWRGGVDNLAVIKEGVQKTSGNIQNNRPGNTPNDHLVKPDSTPSGNAVQVKQQEASDEVNEALKQGSGFFVEYRLERERSRGHQIEIAREIINNNNSDQEIRKKAQEQLYVISNNLQKELDVESLIRAKGFKDAVVFLEGQTVTVVIQAKELSQEDAIKVTDLVSRSTQVNPQNIVIIPKY